MASPTIYQHSYRRRSTSKPYKKPAGHYPTHPDWPDGVTIGLRVQYTGSKAARFPQQRGSVEVPADLLRNVREDLTAVRFGTASPKNGNAHFSSRLDGTVDVVWPSYKVRSNLFKYVWHYLPVYGVDGMQMRPLVDYFISYFTRLRPEALAKRSISCMMFYLLPPYITSLRDHPLEQGLRDFVADERTVDPEVAACCRNALPAGHPSPFRQRSDRTPCRSLESPRVKREPLTPELMKPEASVSTEWTRAAGLPQKPQALSTQDSILDDRPGISRKRPHESMDDRGDELLPTKARRLAEERDVAQARERALQAEYARISDLERSLATYKSCIALTERRERRIADMLDTFFGVTSLKADPLDALEHHYAQLEAQTHEVSREAKRARADLDARGAELGFGDSGPGLTLPVLLGALQQISGIASASSR